jgi:molybdate transport system regulatory protein
LEVRVATVSSRCQTGAGIVSGTRLTLRVDFGPGRSIGPGKIRLLEAIERTGSISQAGRTLGMSYRRAWLLIDDMNQCFRDAVVSARPGGAQGGGAVLTEFGTELVRDYRAIETAAEVAAQKRLRGLEAALRKSNAAKSSAKSAEPKKTSIRRRKP